MATTNDIKNGSVLNIDGQLWNVVEFQHVKPGKGGAFVRTKLKNVMSGKVVDRTFNAGTKIDFATVDRRDFQYLYRDGDGFVFMDTTDYDQITIPAASVGDAANFMLENQEVQIALHEGEALYVELPTSV
ncbi:elongation factor P, partial [Schumannella luteola]